MQAYGTRDQSYLRLHNARMVLDIVREQKGLSRTDLAHLTGMSPTSITRIIARLTELGLIDESARACACARGRKPIGLCMREDGALALGVYLNPRTVFLCLSDLSGRSLYGASSDCSCRTPQEAARAALSLLRAMPEDIAPDRARIRAIGVSVAGIVNPETGVVIRSEQMSWTDAPVSAFFSEAFELPAWTENDVKACLMGERTRLSARCNPAYLLVGSGLGLAVTGNDEQPLRGLDNAAGEISDIVLNPDGNGPADFLKAHLISRCLIERAQQVDPSVKTIGGIVMAYRQGLEWAQVLLGDFRRHLMLVLSMLRGIAHPGMIILGGSTVEQVAHPLLDDLLEEADLHLGQSYEVACMLGASINALNRALDQMILSAEGANDKTTE